ncbi:sacsin N-terminal ATP-binding-like domain-containing protein [Cellulomonas algicola]|uniref:sacsin N-terminal ATP-binding-like domain-containing protein n=2 Tax=Cellulomonas algicola TaxID=2071633 RepID=UPI001CEDE3AD|nr:ATP-binding protein [Cellulomonas algicola]
MLDALGTAALRAAVLGAWRASPARLREDANTEEDHARGYYRDRVVVELAQNAADAATRAGVEGRLLLRLARADDGTLVLVAANTGAPLDEAGVASLASMRASSKRPDGGTAPERRVVGRFGVGFAAVRAVSDEVSVVSTTGGVRFSLRDTAELLADAAAQVPALADEVRRRDGSLPALRLPFPADGPPPAGYDTAVVLQLRDEVAADEVRGLLRAVDDALLLALPALVEVVVEDLTSDEPPRRVADVGRRWLVASAEGELPLALLADRPVEERAARDWRVTWALPRSGAHAGVRVVHAPTPTDEPSTLPALLVATLPLDPTRRRVAAGPLTEALLDRAAQVYATLAQRVAADGGDALALVPTGLADGALDGALRARVVERLARTPLLRRAGTTGRPDADGGRADHPDADRDAGRRPDRADLDAGRRTSAVVDGPDGGAGLVAPRDAVAVQGEAGRGDAVAALGARVAGLAELPPGREAQARTLGVEVRSLADVVEDLPAVADASWPDLYAALEGLADDSRARESLGALPVPLADGRVVRGARGTLMLDGDLADRLGADALDVLGRWGLRIVHPAAEHPLLQRLGAFDADAEALLTQPAVRAAVLAAADDDDLDAAVEVTDAVLAVVAATLPGGPPPEARPWLGLLTLTAADGEPTPADGLVLPGGPAAALLDDRVLAPVSVGDVDRWGADVLEAAGVRADLVVVRVDHVVADAASLGDDTSDPWVLAAQSLDGWEEYLDHLADRLGPGAYVGEAVAVADLDAVADGAWPAVLARVGGEPALRRALVERVRGEDGATAPSYTAWWLRTHADLAPAGPFAASGPGGEAGADAVVAALLPPAPDLLAACDVGVQRALGGVATLAEVDEPAWTALLDAGTVGSPVDLRVAAAVWRAARPDVPPQRVPALVGVGRVAVVRADDAAVADRPMWWQRTDVAAVVPGSARTAELLDLPLVDELAAGEVGSGGEVVDVPAEARALLPDAPATWVEHDDLTVDGAPVDWWVEGAGRDAVVHAVHVSGLAAGLAQAAGRWAARFAVETVLVDPTRAAEVALDAAWGPEG